MANSPRIPPFVSDLVIGGLWCASAVKIGGYTWAAFSNTWSTMPDPNGGSSTQVPSTGTSTTGKAISDAGKIVNGVKTANSAAGSVVGKVEKPVVGGLKWFDKEDGKLVGKVPLLNKLPKWLQ